jgi:hypothetical protein
VSGVYYIANKRHLGVVKSSEKQSFLLVTCTSTNQNTGDMSMDSSRDQPVKKTSRLGRIFSTDKTGYDERERKSQDDIKQVVASFQKERELFHKMTNEERIAMFDKKLHGYNKKPKNLADLCTADGIKKCYLNKDFKSVAEYFKLNVSKPSSKRPMMWSSQSEAPDSKSEFLSPEEEDEDDMNSEDLDSLSRVKLNEKLKIKLIITEIDVSKNARTVRHLVSPIAKAFNLSPQFGMFHSALSIGPWIVEWYENWVFLTLGEIHPFAHQGNLRRPRL